MNERKYVITVNDGDNDMINIKRESFGFNKFELLAILEHTTREMRRIVFKEVEVERIVIKEKVETDV